MAESIDKFYKFLHLRAHQSRNLKLPEEESFPVASSVPIWQRPVSAQPFEDLRLVEKKKKKHLCDGGGGGQGRWTIATRWATNCCCANVLSFRAPECWATMAKGQPPSRSLGPSQH